MASFTEDLFDRLNNAQFAEYHDNYDELRFGDRPALGATEWFAWQLRRVGRRFGFYRQNWLACERSGEFSTWMQLMPELDWFYSRLKDDKSRRLLVDVVAFRMTGYRRIRLPLGNEAYRTKRSELQSLANPNDSIDIDFKGWNLLHHNLSSFGIPGGLYIIEPYTLFEAEQYSHYDSGTLVEEGDTVIDGGGCYGDSAIYFANKAGDTGSVKVFEFVPFNLKVMRKNLSLNPELEKRITVVEKALWNTSDEAVYVKENGPASRVSMEKTPGYDTQAHTSSIDDYVATAGIEKIDFIKMDIEGAEINALMGAEKTIREMNPKLAICLYHSPGEYVSIPRLIHSFCPDYEFYIMHLTMHSEETVLFAKLRA